MKKIINTLVIILYFSFFSEYSHAASKRQARSESQDMPDLSLGITHILPSALVIPGGVIVLGTTVGIGLFDLIDFSSNLYLDFSQVYNLSSKINIFHNDNYAFGIFGTYTTQKVKSNLLDSSGAVVGQVSTTSNAVAPGAVFSYRIFSNLTGHVGGTVVTRNPAVPKGSTDPKRTALVQGSTFNKEFSMGLSRTTAFSGGASYDITYDIWGVGGSLHVGGFQIGAHFYMNVEEGSVLPILGGGYTGSF